MTSLLERMNITSNGGPVRNRGSRASGGARTGPYDRNARHTKGNVNGVWEHDMFGSANSLGDRLSTTATVQKHNFGLAIKAAREAAGLPTGPAGISIKGASATANVVDVQGLVKGTTAADVEAIFKRCGPITQSKVMPPRGDASSVVVRLVFKDAHDARAAVEKFNGQPADGKLLQVSIVGGVNATLGGRIGIAVSDGSADALLPAESSNSKLRSDDLLSDARAQVLVAPPGTDPAEYTQQSQSQRGQPWTRGGRGRRGGKRGGGTKMNVDA